MNLDFFSDIKYISVSTIDGSIETMLYRLADRLLLLKCYDIKIVKLLARGLLCRSSLMWLTNKKNI